jgi:hypothetical protein
MKTLELAEALLERRKFGNDLKRLWKQGHG